MTPKLTHFAINTDDVEATQAFYAEVFGWSFRAYGPPGFVQVLDETGEQAMGAIQQRRQLLADDPTVGFECSFGVEDINDVHAKVLAAGGAVLMGPSTIPSVGHLLAFKDPGGNPVLAMQYDSAAE